MTATPCTDRYRAIYDRLTDAQRDAYDAAWQAAVDALEELDADYADEDVHRAALARTGLGS